MTPHTLVSLVDELHSRSVQQIRNMQNEDGDLFYPHSLFALNRPKLLIIVNELKNGLNGLFG
jgi:hypothetical protein